MCFIFSKIKSPKYKKSQKKYNFDFNCSRCYGYDCCCCCCLFWSFNIHKIEGYSGSHKLVRVPDVANKATRIIMNIKQSRIVYTVYIQKKNHSYKKKAAKRTKKLNTIKIKQHKNEKMAKK